MSISSVGERNGKQRLVGQRVVLRTICVRRWGSSLRRKGMEMAMEGRTATGMMKNLLRTEVPQQGNPLRSKITGSNIRSEAHGTLHLLAKSLSDLFSLFESITNADDASGTGRTEDIYVIPSNFAKQNRIEGRHISKINPCIFRWFWKHHFHPLLIFVLRISLRDDIFADRRLVLEL